MEDTPEISVVIPAHNAASYLSRSVDSVLAQNGCRYELIIVDNNSTDATVEIAKSYEARHPSTIRLITETRPGASAARNKGLASARAPWVQFLDADDMLLPEKLKRQLKLTEPGMDWIIGTIRLRNQEGRETDASIAVDPWQGLLTYTGLGHLDANLFRVEALRKLGGFNEDYLNCNDFELFFRLVKEGNRYAEDVIPGAVFINHNGPRITNTNQAGMARQRLKLTRRVIDHLRREKPEYFKHNQTKINTALLKVLRKQATVDLSAAAENFNHYFPHGYQASDFDQTELPLYSKAYPIFGFGLAERIRVILASALPSPFKTWFKPAS